MIKQLLFTGLGGGLGSICRYLVSISINRCQSFVFPAATFIVNVSGCFLIGLLFGLSERTGFFNNDLKLLLITGFCGGYTTFSTFSAENMKLLHDGNHAIFALYAVASVLTGILAFCSGNLLSKI